MGILERFRRGGAERDLEVRKKAFAEAMNVLEYMLDELGWNEVGGSGVPIDIRRNAETVARWTHKNIRKHSEDAYVKQGVNLHTYFVFGRGIDVPKCKSDVVQEIVNDFWWSSVNQRNFFSFLMQQRRHRETYLSGEMNILVKVDQQTARVSLYPINPADVLEVVPDEEEPNRPAFYLIRHKKHPWDFARNEWGVEQETRILHRALRYKIFDARPEDLENGLVYHVGMNEFFDLMRGQSDIRAIHEPAESVRDMADDGAVLSRANAEVGWKTKILKGGKTIKDRFLDYFKTKTDGSNPSRAAGSEYIENDALDRQWVNARDTGAASRKDDIRAQKLYIFAGIGFGEHYFGDASTGNLATATAMELPVIKMIQAEQRLWESIFTDLVDFQIDAAVILGFLAGTVVDRDELDIDTEENRSFSIKFPPITQRAIDVLVNALATAEAKGFIPEREAARIVMEALEIQDIDEALDELDEANDIQKELDKLDPPPASQTGVSPQDSPQKQPAQSAPSPDVPAPSGGEDPAKGAAAAEAQGRSRQPFGFILR